MRTLGKYCSKVAIYVVPRSGSIGITVLEKVTFPPEIETNIS
jgi:hypothetical protein